MNNLGKSTSKKWTGLLTAAGFLALALVFYFHGIFSGKARIIWDARDYSFPLFRFVADSFRQGTFPLWFPNIFNGYPLFGDFQALIYYPPHWLFVLFDNLQPGALYLSLALHTAFAGWSFFISTRIFNLSITARWIGAITYMFSGYLIGHFSHTAFFYFTAWFPLLFYHVHIMVNSERPQDVIICGVMFAFAFFTGAVQVIFYASFFLLAYGFYIVIRNANSLSVRVRGSILMLAKFAFAGTLALLIGAVQLLPSFELLRQAVRADAVSFESSVNAGTLLFKDLIALLIPNYFGAVNGGYWGTFDITQHYLYIGVIPFFLLVYGALSFRRLRGLPYVFFAIAAAIVLWTALAQQGGLYRVVFHLIPGVQFFRGPVHNFFLFYFALSILTAAAWDIFAADLRDFKYAKIKTTLAAGAFFALLLVIVAGRPAESWVLAHGYLPRVISFFVLFSCAGIFFFLFGKMLHDHKALWVVPLLIFCNLYFYGAYSQTVGYRASNELQGRDPVEEIMQIVSQADPRAEYRFGNVLSDAFTLKGARLTEGYNPFMLRSHQIMKAALTGPHLPVYMILSNTKFYLAQFQPVTLPEYFKSVTLIPAARLVTNQEEALSFLRSGRMDIRKEVLIEPGDKWINPKNIFQHGDVRNIIRDTNQIRFDAELDGSGIAFISETYFNGWTAHDQTGASIPVYRANYDFMAVPLEAGNHTITLRFAPTVFKTGAWISLGGILSAAFLLFCFRRRS